MNKQKLIIAVNAGIVLKLKLNYEWITSMIVMIGNKCYVNAIS